MVPEDLAGPGGRNARSARIPPHDKRSTRRARGLEAAMVDHPLMTITALDPVDRRSYEAHVAGPAALIVAKLHKIGERENTPTRLVNKDAHDLYRILRAVSTDQLVAAFERLLNDDVSRHATEQGAGLPRAAVFDWTGGAGRGNGRPGRGRHRRSDRCIDFSLLPSSRRRERSWTQDQMRLRGVRHRSTVRRPTPRCVCLRGFVSGWRPGLTEVLTLVTAKSANEWLTKMIKTQSLH
jgi:hypothetical protein